jgi:hypothetical protein
MRVKIALGFFRTGLIDPAGVRRTAMIDSILLRGVLPRLPQRPLAGQSEVDQFGHVLFRKRLNKPRNDKGSASRHAWNKRTKPVFRRLELAAIRSESNTRFGDWPARNLASGTMHPTALSLCSNKVPSRLDEQSRFRDFAIANVDPAIHEFGRAQLFPRGYSRSPASSFYTRPAEGLPQAPGVKIQFEKISF